MKLRQKGGHSRSGELRWGVPEGNLYEHDDWSIGKRVGLGKTEVRIPAPPTCFVALGK